MKKRIIALCLVFCMLISMLPMVVLAAETEPAETAEIRLAAEAPDAAVALTAVTADGVCGEALIWALDEEGMLSVTGPGNMDDYTPEEPAPWNEYRESITRVILGDEITGIGAYAFYGLTKLTEVEFSDTVLAIGEAAFCNCEALAQVQLPERCTSIGENAFAGTLWITDHDDNSDASEGEVPEHDPEVEETEETEEAPAEKAGESDQIDTICADAAATEGVAPGAADITEESEQTAPKGDDASEELPTPAEATAAEGVAADDEEAEAVELAELASKLSNPQVVADSSLEAGQKATWDCIWFGSYPQAEVVSSKSMMTAAIGEEVLKDNDYIVDATLYSQLKSATGWDKNNEISIGGNKYRRMRRADATQNFLEYDGYYGWSDSTTYHYFKYQPIKWRVLSTDGSTALLLADECLADIQWNTHEDYGNVWKTSQMRSWLNSYGASANTAGDNYSSTGFLSTAFTAAEKSAIVNGTVKNNVTGNYTDGSGTATTDRIFLLSHAEIRTAAYGFSTNADSWDEARRVRASTYARAQGAYWSTSSSYPGNSWWWLRSAGVSASLSSDVIGGGGNCLCHSVASEDNAVRPALKITLSSSCWSYAGAVCSDGTVVGPCTAGHTWDNGTVIKKATTTITGVKRYTCTICGETKDETIPVLSQLTVVGSNYKGIYDGSAHAISISVSGSSNYAIYYSTSKALTASNYASIGSTTAPSRKTAGRVRVYYYVKDKTGTCEDVSGYNYIYIKPNVTATAYNGTYDGEAHSPVVKAYGSATVYYSTTTALSPSNYSTAGSTTVPSRTQYGTTIVYYIAVPSSGVVIDNVVQSGSTTITIKKPLTVTASDYKGTYDATAHSISISVSGSSKYTIYYSTSKALTASNYASVGSTTAPTRKTAGRVLVYYYVKDKTGTCGDVSGHNYIYIKPKVTATAYSGKYDGQPHSPVVKANGSATVYYSTTTALTASNYTTAGSTTVPTRTQLGTTTVYYIAVPNSGVVNSNVAKAGSTTIRITPANSVSLTPGVQATADITTGGAYSYFTFKPTTTGYYDFYSTGSSDTYGYLYDANMNQLASNDDGGENRNFKITYTLEAGVKYYFGVRYYSSSITGAIPVLLEKN